MFLFDHLANSFFIICSVHQKIEVEEEEEDENVITKERRKIDAKRCKWKGCLFTMCERYNKI
jgi:hypothetical protein